MTAELAGKLILVAAAAYLLGCGNGAILVSKYILHDDVRKYGSGNAGLTNFFRVFGGKTTVLVILADMLKAVLAVLLGALVLGNLAPFGIPLFGRFWGAMFVMLGHDFPCMFGFKGGKGVLSGGAMTLVLDWRVALICWGGFLILVILTRYVSLGSLYAGVAFIIACWFLYPNAPDRLMAICCGGLLIWGHRGNIVRLLKGKENKLTFHKKGDKRS